MSHLMEYLNEVRETLNLSSNTTIHAEGENQINPVSFQAVQMTNEDFRSIANQNQINVISPVNAKNRDLNEDFE